MNKSFVRILDKKKLIKASRMIEEILNIEPCNLKELIFLKYIELENVKNVADYLNINNYRKNTLSGSRKYISTDITMVLENTGNYHEIDKKILFVTLGLKKYTRYLGWVNAIIKLSDEYFNKFKKEDGSK
jgi:hypothetical protein